MWLYEVEMDLRILCGRRISIMPTGKCYKTVVRPVIFFSKARMFSTR